MYFTRLSFIFLACLALPFSIGGCVLSFHEIFVFAISIRQHANEAFFIFSISERLELACKDIRLKSLDGAPDNFVGTKRCRFLGFLFGISPSARNSNEIQTVACAPILS